MTTPTLPPPDSKSTLQSALLYAGAGLSIIPVRADGSKAPACKWSEYQQRRATESEIVEWFRNYKRGLAIVCGAVSGNVELLEFDVPEYFRSWIEIVDESCPGLFERMTVIETPRGGWHLPYRCDQIEGNQKLAQIILDDGELKTAIETRGEGGYFLAPGSPPECHPARRRYVVRAGSLCDLTTITPDERATIFNAARSFNQYVQPVFTPHSALRTPHSTRPGDDYNLRGDWHSLLIPHGWRYCGSRGEVVLWRRPGKSEGISATTNNGGTNHLYVFSSNCAPFESERSYSLFYAFALLEFDGNCPAASTALRARGYGLERPRIALSDYIPPQKPETIRLPEPTRPETIRLPEPQRPKTIRLPQPTRPQTERIGR